MTRRIATFVFTAALATSTVSAQTPAPSPQSKESGGFVAKAKQWTEDHQIMGRLTGEVDGWYPRIGRMTRGGGFALGPGYRTHVLGDDLLVDVSAGMSTKGYKSADANVRWFQSGSERFEFWTDYRFEDFPQEDFYGIGMASVEDGLTSYGFGSHDFQARLIAKPKTWLAIGVNGGYMAVNTSPGSDKKVPSIEALYTDIVAPGLDDQPDFFHAGIYAESDSRDVKGNPASGGFYRVALSQWHDRTLDEFSFNRVDINLNQYVPIDRSEKKKHVIYGRLGLSLTNNNDGHRVPFYFLPYVGGVDTVRSVHEFRFKDENAIWLGAEYLFRPVPYVNFAVFADAGKVEHATGDINLSALKKGYGVGMRFGTKKQQIGRLDFGFGGGEGMRTFFKIGLGL